MASRDPIVIIDHRIAPEELARIQEMTFALIGRGEPLP